MTGRPEFQPTEHQRHLVHVLRANGVPIRIIADNLRISVPTLRKHFRHELEAGRAQIDAALGATVVRAGLAGDWRAAIQWLARWGSPEWRSPRRDYATPPNPEADDEERVHLYTPERKSG